MVRDREERYSEGKMSQQYPGQSACGGVPPSYGGGAPPGPGGGGIPSGNGGGVPHGCGSGVPVASSDGAGMQAPYGSPGVPSPQAPGLAGAPDSNRMLLWVGIGCGGFMLLGLAAVVGGILWFQARANAVVQDLQKLRGGASAASGAPVPPSDPSRGGGVPLELKGDCGVAYACCKAIAARSAGGEVAVQACEVFKTAGYPESTCTPTLSGYRKAAESFGVRCD